MAISNPPLRNFNRRRALFDTNILIDCVDGSRKGCKAARDALNQCNGGGDMGVASPSSLNDAKAFKRLRIRSLTCEEYLEIVNAENDMTRESASE